MTDDKFILDATATFGLPVNQILCGDCLEVMRTFPDGCVDLIVTDPPYGYSFMGKDWDKAVPPVEAWSECLRVLKSGAFAFVMSSPRQDVLSQMIVRLGQAGFDTGFTSIYWVYASGFPKAMNISKAVDRKLGVERDATEPNPNARPNSDARYNDKSEAIYGSGKGSDHSPFLDLPSSEEAKVLDGCYGGFQPKPAVEVVIVCMKPLSEKTYVDQALVNGKGVTWLDDVRIPFSSDVDSSVAHNNALGPVERYASFKKIYDGGKDSAGFADTFSAKGRFPANLLVSDNILNGKVTASNIRLPNAKSPTGNNLTHGLMEGIDTVRGFDDSGSFSRYFDLDRWFEKQIKLLPREMQKTFPFLICAKASKSERNKGCESLPEQNVRKEDGSWGSLEVFSNTYTEKSGNPSNRGTTPKHHNVHPTVKPLKLMSYLVTLGSRPNDVVLDPFCGSGTTGLASKILGRQWIGIDISLEYVEIAQKRLSAIPEKLEGFMKIPEEANQE